MNNANDVTCESGFFTTEGLRMYYEIHGSSGTPLVLIHGGGSTIQTTFGNILPLLARRLKVIAVDLQAHGRSGDRDAPVTFEQDADDVAALVEHLKIDTADFMGFSNGGNTAMQIAIRHPRIVNKLIVASSFYKRDGMLPGFFEGMEHASLESMPEPLKLAYLQVAPNKDNLQVMHDKDKQRMLRFKDWTEELLAFIKVPTLLITADRDIIRPEHAVDMLHKIHDAKLMILPGTHGSYIGEICTAIKGSRIPEMTCEVIEEFLRE